MTPTEQWGAKARAHLERQPLIRGIIVSALKKNPVLPWGKIAAITAGGDGMEWRSGSTIQR